MGGSRSQLESQRRALVEHFDAVQDCLSAPCGEAERDLLEAMLAHYAAMLADVVAQLEGGALVYIA